MHVLSFFEPDTKTQVMGNFTTSQGSHGKSGLEMDLMNDNNLDSQP